MRAALGLAAMGLVCVALGALRWQNAAPSLAVAQSGSRARVSAPAMPTSRADSVDDAAADVVENDPFRLSNAPAAVAFDPRRLGAASGGATVASARAPRPVLVVRAIVGGPPWAAVVDGIPGQPPGTIVRAGESFDRLRVRSVSRDAVVVQAPDTTWSLTFKGSR
jgi:hypothetical protein